ncbi:MAG: SpoIVB peptidase [Candidatus Fimenecus sp.]
MAFYALKTLVLNIFGIKIFTDGILVVGMDDVTTADGIVNPAKRAGLKVGDVVLAVDGKTVQNVSQLSTAVQSGKSSITLTVRRNEKVWQTELTLAVSSNDGKPKAGLWVRDSTAGVGTMTFYCKDTGVFGGLGHAICDIDTGTVMPFGSGEAIKTQISGCYKGGAGITGELCGVFQEESLGTLYSNGETGVYGVLDAYNENATELPVATKNEVKTGYAQIIATVDDTGPQYYDVKITKVYPNSDENGKNMIIEVTDSDLIEKTGGIVQGMSGSPIIQNGMLVGAVTHVFVNNALQGYGIFAETMLQDAEKLEAQTLQNAS